MATQKLPFYRLDPHEVLHELNSRASGLTGEQAAERLKRDGANQLARAKHDSALLIFVRQFRNLLVLILLLSAGFAAYLRDLKTATILLFIAIINTSVGFMQEYKAESLMASLERLVVPKAKVLRDGKLEEVASTELVMGDVVYTEEGDSVPADVRVLEEEELATNDFALTGESNPSRKFVHAISSDVPLGNRHNILFMGTTVATGHGYGVVIGTGMNSELGRIANLSQVTRADSSPLQREMNHLATRLAQGTLILALGLLIIALHARFGVKESLLFAIGIGAAMIPNGLVAEVNITLAQTAGRMARARALVKKLSAVETLGATNLICTDKTGTLTKNEMTVERMLIGKTLYHVSGTGYETNGDVQDKDSKQLGKEQLKALLPFFETGAMASNAKVNPPDHEHRVWYCVGDPTEGALITLARKAGVEPSKLDKKYHEIKEFQFDSARKRMSSVRKKDGELWVFMKGAPESVLERSTTIWDHGHVRKLTAKDRHTLLKYNEDCAAEAMRNLGFAYRVLPAGSKPKQMAFDDVEKNMTFMGIVSMVDPIREQVPAAMKAAQGAHIRVSIITGDYPTTAEAIARKAGLASDSGDITIVLGEQLAHLSDAKVLQLVKQGGTVFSRVSPEDKLRIVELAKKRGKVVAVTGDGINDAPALKRADIGVAMGRTGTDVAKQAADIVLLDDSFNTMVRAIEQGRLTYHNIKKAALCALNANAGELMAVLIGLIGQAAFHVPIAITAIQILAIDVIAQIFPVTALGWDPAQRELMQEPPRNLRDHIINLPAVMSFVGYGLLSAVLAYGNFLLFFSRHHFSPMYYSTSNVLYGSATILTYLTIVLCQFANIMIVRTDERENFFTKYLWSNKKLLIAFGFSLFCILNIIYNPMVRPYFSAGTLGVSDWLSAIAAGLVFLFVRIIFRSSHKHSRAQLVTLHEQVHGAGARAQV
ncbi:MAG TPA: cation-transporting P-type ATPase [Candidatus Saccharimonadales bacterium]|nr:cation-transporting P-type ATPase [Candidatus Saccharimonadales bacterium]